MTEYRIACIPGDGIGPEVTREALKVANAAAEIFGFQLKVSDLPYGSERFLATGEIFPDAAFEEARQHDAEYADAQVVAAAAKVPCLAGADIDDTLA